MSAEQPRITIREWDAKSRSVIHESRTNLAVGVELLAGREGDAKVGVLAPDSGVSRAALMVTPYETGWNITVANRRGVWMYPWAQAPSRLDPGSTLHYVWPRIGIRVVGIEPTIEHWLLLEFDGYAIPELTRNGMPALTGRGPTDLLDIPRPLTPPQMQATKLVFSQHFSWPPLSKPMPRPLGAVANRIGITDTAVADRLAHVRNRAYAFGVHRDTSVSDPEYVYVLARHGYFEIPELVAE